MTTNPASGPESQPGLSKSTDESDSVRHQPDSVRHQPGSVPAAPVEDIPSQAGLDQRGRVRATRVSALWVGLIIAALLLILLLIFIVQNSRTVNVSYLGASGHISLAVALLLAAVAGMLLVALPGTARIVQLRRALRKNHIPANGNK